MRLIAAAALAFALAACGNDDGGELAAGNSQLSKAQIDAALGPEDQSVVDAIVADNLQDDLNMPANADVSANVAADEEDEQ